MYVHIRKCTYVWTGLCCLQEREELELANLAQLYLREVLRTQCWDEMKVKGKVLKVCRSDHAP